MRAGQRGGVQQDAAGARKAHGLVSFRGRRGRRPRPAAAGCGRAAAPAAHRRPPSRASHARSALSTSSCQRPAGSRKSASVSRALTSSSSAGPGRPGRAMVAPNARHAVAPVAGVSGSPCGATRSGPGARGRRAGRCTSGVPGAGGAANGTDMGDEAQQVMVGLRPVHPGDLVVLAVGVVVAAWLWPSSCPRPAWACPGPAARWPAGRAAGAARRESTPGSSVGPSQPQFQLRLWPWPSRLPSWLASLCRKVVADQVGSVKPSCETRS
jgi:hypothetical protein